MGKQADKYIICEPFAIRAEGYDPERNMVSESLFSLANEYMGVRGYPEEGTDAPTLLGSYLGGIYEWGSKPEGTVYRGVVQQTHYMVCAPDWLYARISVNGKQVLLDSSVQNYVCNLDFTSGLLTRSYTVQIENDLAVTLKFERILGMEHYRNAAQRILVAVSQDAEVEIELGVDGSVVHQTTGDCLWKKVDCSYEGTQATICFETGTTNQTADYVFEAEAEGKKRFLMMDRGAAFLIHTFLTAGKTWTAEKRVQVRVNEKKDDSNQLDMISFDDLLKEGKRHYAHFWQVSDVRIEGDTEAQQGIRFCLFQLHQTYRGLNPMHNIGAKGLTGEAYNGHAFWDSETYCLPYYLLSDPAAARGLLMYRYQTLPHARRRARDLDCAGACYPIATLNGDEACTLWQHASLQMQPSTAVAYAIDLYARQTGDIEFLHHEGIEMLTEISRYVVSRGDWNADHTGFGFWGVMGPDEFHMMVNNDFYTNYMGRETLYITLQTLDGMSEADRYATAEERQTWREIADHMIFHQRDDLVYEQQDGFFTLPHLDIHSIPVEEFPLYDHWSYDRIYRTDMIKQPDVLMAMFLHPSAFTLDEIRANYDYYEPRCIHESSLSPSIHAVIAERLGLYEDAFRFFGFATRMDLDNYNRNTGSGLHTTSIAAAWITIVFGFGGLQLLSDGKLSLKPHLPEEWDSLSFNLNTGSSVICVNITKDGSTLSLVDGAPTEVLLNGKQVSVR